jgi:hypothetical protein
MPDAERPAAELIVGCLLMLVGVVLTLERMDIIGDVRLAQFWPVVPLAGGASMILQRRDANGRFWGGFWLLLGACLLANSLGFARVSVFGVAGPVLLILVGLAVMTRTFSHDAAPPAQLPPSVPPLVPPPLPASAAAGAAAADVAGAGVETAADARTEAGDHVSVFAFMANTTRRSTNRTFRGGEMAAMLGQGRLELRQAVMAPGATAVLDVYALMAGHEIYVPPGWEVVSDVVVIMAKVEDARLPLVERRPPDAPRLRLRGFALISGIVIRN